MQGHPESSRSWAILIDKLLRSKLKLKPTTHEPCLYYGTYKNTEVLFLRQVGDFAVASSNDEYNKEIIELINNELTIEIKDLGRLTRYNGVDVTQGRDYVKLSNATYFQKVLDEHEWLLSDTHISNKPLPLHTGKAYNHTLEHAQPPDTEKEQRKLQMNMGFNYRQAIGELIYMMVTCRPDISFPLIKLSQYSKNPAKVHYEAVKHLFKYVKHTISDGIYFWRPRPRNDLPDLPLPTASTLQYENKSMDEIDNPNTIHGAVDSDWGGDSTHRKSVSGLAIRIAGGTILYKTKFQNCIALSSTEAEFTAACDAGRSILYVRSILDEINMPQDSATPLFIDNNGALLMGNAQQPTRRTKHMDLKNFALLDWIERNLLILRRIASPDNFVDPLTKPMGKEMHLRHSEYLLGKRMPQYVYRYLKTSPR